MIGAQALIQTLVDAGVDVCFMNPGTSEMHFVHELDAVPQMRSVLTLFEGVATGAADGYARMAGRPSAVLLHMGPGLGNGLANLHNARRAYTPLVCIVGAHAIYHERFDALLQSDIAGVAHSVSGWFRTSLDTRDVARDAADAVAAAYEGPGQIATLVLPADVSWGEGAQPARPRILSKPQPVDTDAVASVANVLSTGESTLLLLGGSGMREPSLRAASRIAAASGAQLLGDVFPSRQERGAGLPRVDRMPYLVEYATKRLNGIKHIVLAGARSPVSFFAYPGWPSDLVPDGCQVHTLVTAKDDVTATLETLADRVAPNVEPVLAEYAPCPVPSGSSGPLDVATLAAAIGSTLPEGAVVVDEANTSSFGLPDATANAPRHDWLTNTGGAIGFGLPAALGAAIAVPDRPVLCLQADGSALYTPQALWSMAHYKCNVTIVLIRNDAYSILRLEMKRVGTGDIGRLANEMLTLSDPVIDHTSLARGFGIDACQVTSAASLVSALRRAYDEPGPHLIEAIVPALY
jgi:acetolactate synthase-1/2/3 large subunit